MSSAKSASVAAAAGTGSVRLRIGGMTCEHCVARVRSALEGVEGVASAEVVLADEMATVVGSASAATLIEAVEDMGKSASLADAGAARPSVGSGSSHSPSSPIVPPSVVQTREDVEPRDLESKGHLPGSVGSVVETFNVGGMTCSSCSGRIESVLGKVEGVSSADVNLLMNTATVKYDANTIGSADIVDRVESLGFDCSSAASPDRAGKSEGVALLSVRGMTCASCTGTTTWSG